MENGDDINREFESDATMTLPRERAYMAVIVFGLDIISMTRSEYDKLPRLLQRIADYIIPVVKRD